MAEAFPAAHEDSCVCFARTAVPCMQQEWERMRAHAAGIWTSGATSSDGRLRRQFGSKLLILRTWIALLILRWCSTLTTFKDSKSSWKKKKNKNNKKRSSLSWPRAGGPSQGNFRKQVKLGNPSTNRPRALVFSNPLFGNRTLFFLFPTKSSPGPQIKNNNQKISVVSTEAKFHLFLFQTLWNRIVRPHSSVEHSWKGIGWVTLWFGVIKQRVKSTWCSVRTAELGLLN